MTARAKRVPVVSGEPQGTDLRPPRAKAYHHGDLAPALREAALEILERKGLAALSLRSVAKRAGVSHAAPYRHYRNLEALLADVATIGFEELRAQLRHAAASPRSRSDHPPPFPLRPSHRLRPADSPPAGATRPSVDRIQNR